MKAAVFVRDIVDWRGDARLYRLYPPIVEREWRGDKDEASRLMLKAHGLEGGE